MCYINYAGLHFHVRLPLMCGQTMVGDASVIQISYYSTKLVLSFDTYPKWTRIILIRNLYNVNCLIWRVKVTNGQTRGGPGSHFVLYSILSMCTNFHVKGTILLFICMPH